MDSLNDYNEVSLSILAWKAVAGKEFPFKCNGCTMQHDLNCDMSRDDVITIEDDDKKLTTCPLNYIIPQHYEFLEKYYYLQEFPHTAVEFELQDKLFWQWYSIFKSEYNNQQYERQKESMKKK